MVDYEKYKLSKEDIDSGIQDFFTQLLTEAKMQKSNAKTLDDLSSEKPTVSFNVGQPGSGKSCLGKYIQKEYNERGECIVEIGSDKIATYHKYYDEIVKLLPKDGYAISREFVRPAQVKILQTLQSKRINIISENTFNKGEKDYNDVKDFLDRGYRTQVNIMVVDKYESFLSCLERDIKLLELGYRPRRVAKTIHDKMYEPYLSEIIEMNKRKLLDEVKVYIRGKSFDSPILVYTNDCNNYSSVGDAVLSERAKLRKNLLKNSEKYFERINIAKEKLKVLVHDKEMKNNYLEELEEIEQEFREELSFDRNIN